MERLWQTHGPVVVVSSFMSISLWLIKRLHLSADFLMDFLRFGSQGLVYVNLKEEEDFFHANFFFRSKTSLIWKIGWPEIDRKLTEFWFEVV